MTEPNRPCPRCRDVGRDTTGDHLFLMSDQITWACLKKSIHPPYFERDGEETKGGDPEVYLDTTDVEKLGSASVRGIPKETLEKYGVKVQFSETAKGEVDKIFFPTTVGGKKVTYKFKDLTVAKGSKGHFGRLKTGIKDIELFGKGSYPFTPEYCVITEGELDAPAADHMLRSKFKKLECLSVPDGAQSGASAIARDKDYICRARHVIICADNDEEGQKFLKKACAILPDAKVMSFSEKDACDMLKAGKQVEFVDAFVNASRYKPSCIVTAKDVKEEAIAKVQYGLGYPFKRLNDLTYGIRPKRIIGIGAAPGAGKTAFIRAIQKHLCFHHKIPIGVFGLEESPAEQQREMAGYIMNKPLHLPDCQYDHKELSAVIDSFDDKVFFYDRSFYKVWPDILDSMTYMVSLGVLKFFIDPISALVAHLPPSEGNQYLSEAMYALSLFVERWGATVWYTSHLNNPQTGKDHGAGGKVYAGQFTGSKAMWRYSHDLWGASRDQYAEDEVTRNTLYMENLKYRKPSQPGHFSLIYDPLTGTLNEPKQIGNF